MIFKILKYCKGKGVFVKREINKKAVMVVGIILIVIGVSVGIPYALENLVFENSVYSPVSNDGWAGFFGSYIGSIIGAIGIAATLVFSKTENDRIIQATKEENDRIIKENEKIFNLQLIESRRVNQELRQDAQEERRLMIEENQRMLRHQIRPYFSYHYTINVSNSDPRDTILLVDQAVDVQRTGTQYFDFLSMKNVGVHSAGNVCVHRYKLKVVDECEKELNLFIDRLLHDKLQTFCIVEKEELKEIILPFGVASDEYKTSYYELELIIKYEDVSGYVYYDRVLIKNNKAVCVGRFEGDIIFNTDYKCFN